MTKKRVFGELELTVLEAVRSYGPVTVKRVQEILGGRDRYTTVMTVMSRLAEKGELLREKEGRQYVYRLANTKSQPKGELLELIKRKVFSGRSAGMIAYLLESSAGFTEEELDELEELIRQARDKEQSE